MVKRSEAQHHLCSHHKEWQFHRRLHSIHRHPLCMVVFDSQTACLYFLSNPLHNNRHISQLLSRLQRAKRAIRRLLLNPQ